MEGKGDCQVGRRGSPQHESACDASAGWKPNVDIGLISAGRKIIKTRRNYSHFEAFVCMLNTSLKYAWHSKSCILINRDRETVWKIQMKAARAEETG